MRPTRRHSFPGSGSRPGTNGWGAGNIRACSSRGKKVCWSDFLRWAKRTSRLKGTPARVRRISFLGDQLGGSDYLDVLALPGYEQECANVLFGHIAEHVEFDIMELDGLPCDSPSAPWLAWRFGSGVNFKYRLEPRYVCPQVKLDKPWEELLRSSSRASYFSRSLRRLQRLPG